VAEWPSEGEFDQFLPEGFEEEDLEEEFASEPLYAYHTALDERVCGRCAPLEGVMFTLDEINEQFPSNENYEDVIFVNLHDKCRCQLIREEGEMDGRGTPLSSGAWLSTGMILSPQRISRPRSLLQYGISRLFSFLGIGAVLPFLFPVIAWLMPIIQASIQSQVQLELEKQIKAEIAKQLEAERKEREEMMRQVYKVMVGE